MAMAGYFTCTKIWRQYWKGQVWRYILVKAQAGGTIELFVEPNEQSV